MLQRFFEKLAVKNHRRRIRKDFRELEREVGSYGCFKNARCLESKKKEDSIRMIEEHSYLKGLASDEDESLAKISLQLGNLFDSMRYFAKAGNNLVIYPDDDVSRAWYKQHQRKICRHSARAIRQELERRNSRLI
jgi:hypothetical protein